MKATLPRRLQYVQNPGSFIQSAWNHSYQLSNAIETRFSAVFARPSVFSTSPIWPSIIWIIEFSSILTRSSFHPNPHLSLIIIRGRADLGANIYGVHPEYVLAGFDDIDIKCAVLSCSKNILDDLGE